MAALLVALLALSIFCFSASAQDSRPLVGPENLRPLLRSGFQISAQPEWSIDLRTNWPTDRVNVVGAIRVKNGIVVAEGIGPHLLYYSRDLRLTRVVDLKFAPRTRSSAVGLQRVNGDTLAVLGIRQGWILNAGDTVPLGLTFAEPGAAPGGRIAILSAVLSNGSSLWSVMNVSSQHRPPRQRFTDSVDLVLQSPTREIRNIGRAPAMMLATDSAGTPRQMWFYAHLVYTALQENFYYGFGSDYLITHLNPLTGRQQAWRRAWTPRKVTAADIEEFINGWSINWNKGADSIAVKAAMHNDPFAASVPAFSQFLVSTARELWVRAPELVDAQGSGELNTVPFKASTWSVFDEKGRWLTDIELPAGFQPTDIGSDYVLGVQIGMKDGAPRGRERNLTLYRYSRLK